jgi:PAS domain S-box-containing protein
MPTLPNKSAEQKVAEAEVEGFRKALGPFVVAAESTRMAMVFTDAKEPDNPIIFANASFLSLTGYDRQEVLGQSFNLLMARGSNAEALAHVQAAFAGRSDGEPEFHYRRKDGSEFWASIFISPVPDGHGEVVQNFVSLVDLTRHHQSKIHAEMLIAELNHRVKNTLSTVQSIAKQALRTPSAPEVIRESIESRLVALSRSHDLLTRESWRSVGLLDLMKEATQPFGVANGPAARFAITGENIRLSPKSTLALGIAIHELATNAVKHGALSNEAGFILIAWTVQPGPDGVRLHVRWQERNGPRVTPPLHKGFGSQVIERGLAHELEGTVHLDYPASGVVCTINIPAPSVAADG